MEEVTLEFQIQDICEKFLQVSNNLNKEIMIISHHDTDGITSAAIMMRTLKSLDKKFSVTILKNLEQDFIYSLPKNKIIIFLDLGSGGLDTFAEINRENIFIIDHHEIPNPENIPSNLHLINSELCNKEKISASGLTYLFCKQLNPKLPQSVNKLAVLGMIGDLLEKEIDKLNNGILVEGQILRKRGLLLYPSTRPINRVLEYCSQPYIPEVTGDAKGVTELLREVGLAPKGGQYKTLLELNEEEMQKLVTAIVLRNPKTKNIIGDIFLIKMFNKLEDAREVSAMINACSRLGKSHIALQFCLEISGAKKKAETVHIKYKQFIVSGLKFVSKTQKIQGKGFIIINAKDNIKDTIIGTIGSILSNSALYEPGTIIITMAQFEDKIKISARSVGRTGRNLREALAPVIQEIGGEVGGHEFAAGALIQKTSEQDFINLLKKNLEIELVKI